jgi:hypothetical protein
MSATNAPAASTSSEKTQVFLESDPEIRGQKYACLSFLTPNRGILRNKDIFFFSKFMESFNMKYKIDATESFVLGQIRDVQNLLSDVELTLANTEVTDASGTAVLRGLVTKIVEARAQLAKKSGADLEAHVKTNLDKFKESDIVESYEKYMLINRQRLEDEFHKSQSFQTTMHGLKVRGVFSTYEQAAAHGKKLSKSDPYFNVYVADVGEWLPWDPDPEEVQSSEYQNESLNKLKKAYADNAALRDAFFEEDKRQRLAEATIAKRKIGDKPSFGSNAAQTDAGAAAVADSMFGSGGDDLFLSRKAEESSSTISHT